VKDTKTTGFLPRTEFGGREKSQLWRWKPACAISNVS